MEERIPMKLLTAVWLTLALLITGCASTSRTTGVGSSDGTDSNGASGAVYPSGPLKPIASSTIHDGSSSTVAHLAPPADLWERIRRGFAMPDLQNDLVTQREQWYLSRPDYLQRITERSSKYMFHIVEELERRGMPTELALLPFVESAYNPGAVSSAKAVGMWQFMPATGTDYQLRQNVFRDDRRDVLASTRAALDYLQKLHGMFGDWQLALAAYNWGEGSVSRAIAKNQKLGLPVSYSDIQMPEETRNYVPKLQALKNIIAHPERFNTELPVIENHPYFQSVDITRDMDVALVAKLADVSVDDFRELNPSMKHPVILAAGTPQILLPWDNAAVFRRNLEAYTVGQYASWTAWTVPSTMTASAAAKQAGMSEDDLRKINAIPPRMLIRAGSTLIVPRSATMQEDVTLRVADNGHLTLAPEIVTRRTTFKARRRETVATVARRFHVSASQVADWNDAKPSTVFRTGQQLVVYVPVQAHRESHQGSHHHGSAKASSRHERAAPARGHHASRSSRSVAKKSNHAAAPSHRSVPAPARKKKH
jgi:membrane-bound lytic murein transglycosylase D